ncbi:AraC family transcriptional regulator [Hyalangium minutum]|uniref:Transcriptional regulator, AraC family protein n=1 Tax=Hyalangium minutum TaxID=394096 RepID=A0A085WW65_9BACT|nr:AraC family transcriptional regulator [Hyalangium minutum]KFE71928.1 Transcriptional regulator, AraC family protein [Hyalangium minutum]
MHSRASESPLPEPAHDTSDPLAAVISLLRPQTVLSKVISGAGRWSVRYDAHEDPGFCLMLEGSCFLDLDGIGSIKLEEGDFILLPATPGFTMASDLGIKPKLIKPTHTNELRHGTQSGPPTMRQLGGYFRFDRTNAQLVVSFLPSMIHIRRDEPGATRLRRVVELISEETAARRPGRDLILGRLVEVLLVEALRFRPAEAAGQEKGLLAGLTDSALARALRRMHDDVAHRWTVADLARTAGMSRASFAERFMRTVGVPPMEYLLEWRIAIAKDLLRRERVSLSEVAEMIGYQSASAFSTAFSRHAGCSPSEFARSMRIGSQPHSRGHPERRGVYRPFKNGA